GVHELGKTAGPFDLVDDPVPVADRLQRDRRAWLTARQKLLERAPLMGQSLFADRPPVHPRHRGQGVMLVGIERDIFHLLRLLSRLTPPECFTHTHGNVRAWRRSAFMPSNPGPAAKCLICRPSSGDYSSR